MVSEASCANRGYPIEELAEHCSFLDVAHLLINGELPDKAEAEEWTEQITHHTFIHENIKKFIDGFHHDAHPMGILVGTVGGAVHLLPGRQRVFDESRRRAAADPTGRPRCRPWRRSPTGTREACPTPTRTTTFPKPATSST